MSNFNLNINTAKKVYNWFHFAFPNFRKNDICTKEDIKLRNDIEEWLESQGE